MDRQRNLLRAHFARRLLELEPRSHLDVGAGEGELVREARARCVLSIGLEPEPCAAAPAHGVRGSALDLPFADAIAQAK